MKDLTIVMLAELLVLPDPNFYLAAALDESYPEILFELPLRYNFQWQHMNRGRYAEEALTREVMSCIDPRNGQKLESKSSWVMPAGPAGWVCIAYEFVGSERFILITNSFDQCKLGIYFTDTDLLVIGLVDEGWREIAIKSCEELKLHLTVMDNGRVVEDIRVDHKPVAVLYIGFVNNIGHYIWNELSGIELALKSGSIRKIKKIVVGPYCFFPIEDIFQELIIAKINIEKMSFPMPSCIRHENTLPLRLAGNRISYKLRSRVVAWALESSQEDLPVVGEFNDRCLNIWVNLRSHNKSWIGQARGICDIVDFMRKSLYKNSNIRIFLDGTPDTKSLAGSISEMIGHLASIVDATDIPLHKSIALSSLIDLHICVIGSGLIIPHWIMGRRGIAHSNRAHLRQQSFWNNVSEGAHDVLFVPENSIFDHEGPALPNIAYVNYDLHTHSLTGLLDILLKQLDIELRRSAVIQMLNLSRVSEWERAASRVISV